MFIFLILIVATVAIATIATVVECGTMRVDIVDAIGHWLACAIVAMSAMAIAWALIFAITTVIGF